MQGRNRRKLRTIKGHVAHVTISHRGDLITVRMRLDRKHGGRVFVDVNGADKALIDRPPLTNDKAN